MRNAALQQRLRAARGFVFDIDGTLALADRDLNGYQPLPGALQTLALLAQRGTPFVAFTNGSTKTPQQLAQALGQAGFDLDPARTLTPLSVAVEVFLRKRHRRVLVLGGEGVWRPLADAGIDVVRAPDRADDADAVLIGWHPAFGRGDLDAACRAVWGGAALYTVSAAATLASRDGRTLGISGALAAAVRSVTGKRAVVVGKPSPTALKVACARLGAAAADIAIVGDDPSLENAMALRGGALSVAVHTGLAGADDFAALPEGQRPHLSLPGMHALLALLR
ncbi:MAG TPA: HAD hydrolase-like protein [Pseudorhodoferax sp.]|jgi:NagD protein|nr:HAD hydrolase-like protein [Pseudorhodoferax sp.]